MLHSIFQSTTIPVLEQVVNFAQTRHTVLAGNIANLDTPGYLVRDLSVTDFQAKLKEAVKSHRARSLGMSPGEPDFPQNTPMAEVAQNPKSILYHDKSNVGLEHQVTEMVKNQMQHNLALTIMSSQFRLLKAAISGQA